MNTQMSRSTAPAARMLLIALASLGILATPAAAQYFEDPWPAPITSRDLNRWAARLDMSLEQLNGAYGLHDSYKEQYFALSEEFSTTFIPLHDVLEDLFLTKPSPNEFRQAIGMQRQVWSRIAALDQTLFDSLQQILADEQQPLLELPRHDRAQQRVLNEVLMKQWLGEFGAFADISHLIDELNLSGPVRLAVQPQLARYENEMTTALNQLFNSLEAMREEFHRQIRDLDYKELRIGAGPVDIDLLSSLSTAWRGAAEPIRPLRDHVIDLQRTSFEQIANSMPILEEAEFRIAYLTEHHLNGRQPVSGIIDEIRALREMPEDNNDTALQMRQSVERAIPAIREHGSAFARFRDDAQKTLLPRVRPNEYIDRMNEAEEARNLLVTTLVNLSEQLDDLAPEDESPPPVVRDGPPEDPIEAQLYFLARRTDASRDNILPTPVRRDDLRQYATMLNLNDAQQSSLDRQYDDYLRAYLTVNEPFERRAGDEPPYLGIFLRKQSDGQMMSSPAPMHIVEMHMERDPRILNGIQSIDARLLDELEKELAADQRKRMWRVRLHRDFDVYGRWNVFRSWQRTMEDRINLVKIIDDAELSDESRAAADAILEERAASISDALRSSYFSNRDARYAYATYGAANTYRQEYSIEQAEEYRQTHLAADRRAHRQRQDLIGIIAVTAQAITHALPEGERLAFTDAYETEAFPELINPGKAFVRRLNDLSHRQAGANRQGIELTGIVLGARQELKRINDQLIQTARQLDAVLNLELGYSDDQRILLERRKMLEFERDELIVRTDARLDRLLQIN